MELSYVITLYVSVVVLLTILLSYYGIRLRGGLVISLLIGQILLNFIAPPMTINSQTIALDSWIAFYFVIQIGTPLYVMLYAFSHAIFERKNRNSSTVAIYVTD